MRFSIITTAFETWHFLPRALACIMQQEHPDWELLIAVDGPAPTGPDSPRQLVHQLHRRDKQHRIEYWELPRAEGCWGNAARHFALSQARGDYVCWVNHDNLVTPRYLAAHAENIARQPGCLSIVDIDLWQKGRYIGRFPRALKSGKIDLLNFAVPLATARDVDAFGPAHQKEYAADGRAFEACCKRLPVEHRKEVVGTHF